MRTVAGASRQLGNCYLNPLILSIAECTECSNDHLGDAHVRGLAKSLLSYLLHLADGFAPTNGMPIVQAANAIAKLF